MQEYANFIAVTPARNEGQFLEETIRSMLAQTIRPLQWIIVSDNSEDQTESIVEEYSRKHEFIQLVRIQDKRNRDFSAKVRAFEMGLSRVTRPEYDYIANLDADVTLPSDYYARVIGEFRRNPRLGVAGGVILERNGARYSERFSCHHNIAGAIQVLSRRCYEEIGGYIPLKFGGEDAASQYMARMRGWEVMTISELGVIHHRPRKNTSAFSFNMGAEEYCYGSHPMFQLVKCLYRVVEPPYALGGMCRMAGYVWAFLNREPRVPEPVREYIAREQIQRMCMRAGMKMLAAERPPLIRRSPGSDIQQPSRNDRDETVLPLTQTSADLAASTVETSAS